MTATTSPAPLPDHLPPACDQSWSLGVVSGSASDSVFERICGWRIPALRKMGLDMLATMTEAEAETELRKLGSIDCVLTDEPWGNGYTPNWHATLEHRRTRVVLEQGHGATRRGALIMALCDYRWRNAKVSHGA